MKKKTKVTLLIVLVVLLVGELGFLGFRAWQKNAGSESVATEAPTAAPTEVPIAAPTAAPTEAPTAAPTEVPTEAPTEAPTESPVLYTDPLTGEVMDHAPDARIFAVTINNVRSALPHVGVEDAGLFFEMFVNGYATRGLALYSDIREADVVGSVRSWRYNFTDLAVAYDAYGAHAGGSAEVLQDARNSGIDHVNVVGNDQASFRDKDRQKSGYSYEHTLFLKGSGMYEYAQQNGYRVTQEAGKSYGLNFAEDGTPAGGEAAGLINITFRHDGKTKPSTMTYDETLGKYLYTQYGKGIESVTDANREPFENVFVILAEVRNKGEYHVANLDGSGEGYYACGGKIIKIRWHHENPADPISFTLEDGTPLVQGVGNSYIAICPLKSTVAWE